MNKHRILDMIYKKMKNIGILLVILSCGVSSYSQYDNIYWDNEGVLDDGLLEVSPDCINIGFESTDFSAWYTYWGGSISGISGLNDGILNHAKLPILPSATSAWPEYGILNNKLFEHIDDSYSDPFFPGMDMTPSGTKSLRIGAPDNSNRKAGIKQRIVVDKNNAIFEFNYAVVLEYPLDHSYNEQPFFRFYLEDANFNFIDCSDLITWGGNMSDYASIAGNTVSGNTSHNESDVYSSEWSTHYVNLLDYVDLHDEVTIVFEVASCISGHFAYAYLDGKCLSGAVNTASFINCSENSTTFSHPMTAYAGPGNFLWNFYDNAAGDVLVESRTDESPSYTFPGPGEYLVELEVTADETCFSTIYDQIIRVVECCDTCSSFQPEGGKKYWLSAWVKEEHLEQVKSYEMANISLRIFGTSFGTSIPFFPTGDIIDGWQRIVGEFDMPLDANQFTVQLNSHPWVDTYFDDIRIHPYNGSMKSYVYDGETFWLTSELDDNNYATFYEYDEEGGLVRIKKETARGIVTIQETRSNTIKKDD